MVLYVVGDTMLGANLEMELEEILLRFDETHRLKYRALELEELQLQSLLETTTPALFLTMHL